VDTIKIQFYTENIDVKKYERVILEYIFSHVNRYDLDKSFELNKWRVEIRPTSQSNMNFDGIQGDGVINVLGIPHGVTNRNLKRVVCFVNDMKGDMVLQQNFKTSVGHELAHFILTVFFPSKRVIPRHKDRSWNNSFSEQFYSTTEVHDREFEMSSNHEWVRMMKTFRYNILGQNIGTLIIPCLELRDITDSRSMNRV
jgi:hypothetical protein